MDQTTHEVRLANWRTIIEQCQARPEGQTTRQWLAENNVPEKKYYYWLRKIRKAALTENKSLPDVPNEKQLPAVSFVELQGLDIPVADSTTAIKITTKKTTFEISTAVSDALMIELVKAVTHAL